MHTLYWLSDAYSNYERFYVSKKQALKAAQKVANTTNDVISVNEASFATLSLDRFAKVLNRGNWMDAHAVVAKVPPK